MHNFMGKDFLTVKGVERADFELIFAVTHKMEDIVRARTRSDMLADKILGLMFFQVSTRTRISFESAMTRLGGGVVGFVDPKTTRAGDYYQEINKNDDREKDAIRRMAVSALCFPERKDKIVGLSTPKEATCRDICSDTMWAALRSRRR